MNNVQYAMMLATANRNGINNLFGISGSYEVSAINHILETSGSYGVNGINPYSVPSDYVEPDVLLVENMIRIMECKHCGQLHRVDESKLDAITVLDCQKCGGSLI